MAELFQKGRTTITEHIKNIFDEEELEENSVSRKFRHTASDGKDVLQNAGTISHEQALKKATEEYDKFKELNKNTLSKVEEHFLKQIENTNKKLK